MIRFSGVETLIMVRQNPNHGQEMIQIEPETEPEKRVGNASKCRPFGGTKSMKTHMFSLCFRMKWSPEGGPKMGPEMSSKWS